MLRVLVVCLSSFPWHGRLINAVWFYPYAFGEDGDHRIRKSKSAPLTPPSYGSALPVVINQPCVCVCVCVWVCVCVCVCVCARASAPMCAVGPAAHVFTTLSPTHSFLISTQQ